MAISDLSDSGYMLTIIWFCYVFLVGMVICFTLGLVTSFNSYVDCHMNQLTWLLKIALFGWLSKVINTVWYCMLHKLYANTVQYM